MRMRNKNINKKGFTMVEVMAVVAIIGILAAVSFIGVIGYLHSMAQIERDSVAKELFISAQNHLSMSSGQNYLGREKYGTITESSDPQVYYYVVNKGDVLPDDNTFDNSLIGLMLPFGAIDETVRHGGSYVIAYQKDPAKILDVFYNPGASGKYGMNFDTDSYTSLMSVRGDDYKSTRQSYGEDKAVIGWYGGEGRSEARGARINATELKVENGAKLQVRLTNKNVGNSNISIRLLLTGLTSGAKGYVDVLVKGSLDSFNSICSKDDNDDYIVVLDDISNPNLHFEKIAKNNITKESSSPDFIPGENIEINCVTYNNEEFTNIAYSAKQTVNSLFSAILETMPSEEELEEEEEEEEELTESLEPSETPIEGEEEEEDTTVYTTAVIRNIRHLENLDKAISNVSNAGDNIAIVNGVQTTDLDWEDYVEGITESRTGTVSIFKYTDSASATGSNGYYLPINMNYETVDTVYYNGINHYILNVPIKGNDNSGIFGEIKKGDVQNLAIVDCKNESNTGNVGIFAGKLDNSSIKNICVFHTKDYEELLSVQGVTAGGLVGLATDSNIELSCASVYVKGTTVGGFIGQADDSEIKDCYSGGHTKDGQYVDNTTITSDHVNIIGEGTSGGFIGVSDGSTIENSYTTCSVSGGTAGGFVGNGAGTITNCYCTGLVLGTTKGAFAGELTATTDDCNYFELACEEPIKNAGNVVTDFNYLKAVSSLEDGEEYEGISKIDDTEDTYDTFMGAKTTWTKADPYDDFLLDLFEGNYNYKSIGELDSSAEITDDLFVSVHYGDWFFGETDIVNLN